MTAARATGLVVPDGSLIPIVRTAILASTPEPELWSMRRELVDAMETAGLPLGEAAVELARLGFRDPRVANALRTRADELLGTEPVQAWRLYASAIEAGADGAALAGRRAQAAWAAGDIRAAERLVDGLLARAERPDLPRVMLVAAAIWARKGMLSRSVDAYLTSAEGVAAPLAAICLVGVGNVAQARSILASAPDVDYPTSSHVALSLSAEGILSAIEGATDRALSSLLQASSVMSDSGELIPLPEPPAVLAAQVALNAGELGIANEVLQSAIDASEGGPAFRNRLRLMQSLIALRADRPARARTLLELAESSQHPLGLRDEVLAHAIRVGLARHTDDVTSLIRAWNAARQVIARMPVDLYVLPALTELAIAAARLDESHLVETHVGAAWDLLERVGQPEAWSTSLHWAAIQAAILRNDSPAFEQHTAALLDAASGCRVAGQLAHAGQIWAAALAGEVDVATVEGAVRDLAAAGYPWDASRLAGHAAARAPEHKDTLQLLALARGLHPDETPVDSTRDPADSARDDRHDDRRLSAREREVARLVLEGKTYAEIGTAIFISPRTAEHHIARIRRRLGVSTRSELLAELRRTLDDGDQGR
jgi:DNA-binding CsgD family transcriptional regulator